MSKTVPDSGSMSIQDVTYDPHTASRNHVTDDVM